MPFGVADPEIGKRLDPVRHETETPVRLRPRRMRAGEASAQQPPSAGSSRCGWASPITAAHSSQRSTGCACTKRRNAAIPLRGRIRVSMSCSARRAGSADYASLIRPSGAVRPAMQGRMQGGKAWYISAILAWLARNTRFAISPEHPNRALPAGFATAASTHSIAISSRSGAASVSASSISRRSAGSGPTSPVTRSDAPLAVTRPSATATPAAASLGRERGERVAQPRLGVVGMQSVQQQQRLDLLVARQSVRPAPARLRRRRAGP